MCMRVNTCCFVATPETGSKIIAYFLVVYGIILTILDGIEVQWAGVISGLLMALSGIILAAGVHQRSRFFLILFLIVSFLVIAGHVITVVWSIFALISGNPDEIVDAGKPMIDTETNGVFIAALIGLILSIVSTGLYIYFWIVIYSFQEQIKEESIPPPLNP